MSWQQFEYGFGATEETMLNEFEPIDGTSVESILKTGVEMKPLRRFLKPPTARGRGCDSQLYITSLFDWRFQRPRWTVLSRYLLFCQRRTCSQRSTWRTRLQRTIGSISSKKKTKDRERRTEEEPERCSWRALPLRDNTRQIIQQENDIFMNNFIIVALTSTFVLFSCDRCLSLNAAWRHALLLVDFVHSLQPGVEKAFSAR